MLFFDTHTHIHESDFEAETGLKIHEVLDRSAANNVCKIVLIGTSVKSSIEAIDFAKKWNKINGIQIRVAIGIHPHEADPDLELDFAKSICDLEKIIKEDFDRDEKIIVAIGEIGLDYFYDFDFRERQEDLLIKQLELAKKYELPVNFHIRNPRNIEEAHSKVQSFKSVWDDFWPIYDSFFDKNFSRNILHSYTEQSRENLDNAINRNLLFGVNGISTFAKKEERDLWAKDIPLDRMVLETDAPLLTPHPFRGHANEPARINEIAINLAQVREKSLDEIMKNTTKNAKIAYRF